MARTSVDTASDPLSRLSAVLTRLTHARYDARVTADRDVEMRQGEWVIRASVRFDDPRPLVVRLAIEPAGDAAEPGIGSTLLRSVSIPALVQRAAEEDPGVDLDEVIRRLSTSQRPKNKEREDTFYAWVAACYLRAQRDHLRPYALIRDTLADLGWYLGTNWMGQVAEFVRGATTRGFLLETGKTGKQARKPGPRFDEAAQFVLGRTLETHPQLPQASVKQDGNRRTLERGSDDDDGYRRSRPRNVEDHSRDRPQS